MNSERELFEEWARCQTAWDLYWSDHINQYMDHHTNGAWLAWQASTKRQGYKLVPVEVLERAISHISIAMRHPNNTRNEEDIMHNDMVIIEKAMIGAVDE